MSELTAEIDERVCGNCGKTVRPLHIVYGLPTEETSARARAGEFRLGGCVINVDSPKFAFPACHKPFDLWWGEDWDQD